MDYEHIERMTQEFNRLTGEPGDEGEFARWQIRVQLAIAQQLSVIAGHLKDANKLREFELGIESDEVTK